ncbi:TPR repeat protein [Natronocella acetinitrilica]|jgi:TPR repeat protein|uniref:TPR repeat protein n=1 Tax=Natronocella acetinitrilica TaxID=414046 RepID=A0AAE3G3F8_9GAMM|nr:hypothetical protein [Natronocella acetinitrilica]MCP1675105.1 TPR repeat protein [Natronocella acetinitrilica]
MGFKHVSRGVAALALALLLAGCAGVGSSAPSERFDEGRAAWEAGDYSRAFELMVAEAEAGNADAQYTVGYMYYTGQGVQRDERAAIRWIQRAAGNGSARAMQALGELANIGARYHGDENGDDEGAAGEIFD